MKVWHTADWHLGKRLHEQSLHADQALFFEWMLGEIERRGVDVLLVSGDAFDTANPPTESRALYYSVLTRLAALNVQVVVTGGNHDSPSMLNAPKDLLEALRIRVIGELPEDLSDALIPLGPPEAPEAVVAAIPFVRDNALRQITPGLNPAERQEAIRTGLHELFHAAGAACEAKYPGLPALAMGHLYAAGTQLSESEREIQVGNLAGVEPSTFPAHFQYVALGHIHKPQPVAPHIRYSGSPIPLSFSERDQQHRVLEFTIDSGQISAAESVHIPAIRKLVQVSGDLQQVRERLERLPANGRLSTLIEARLVIGHADPAVTLNFSQLVEQFNALHSDARIVKQFIELTGDRSRATDILPDADLKQLQPPQVFEALLDAEGIEDREALREAFQELIQELQQDERA